MSSHVIEQMAVEVEGDGGAVVMIHGLGGTSNTFNPQMAVTRDRYRSIRPDLPCSGRSANSEAPSIQAFADRVVRAIKVLGVTRAHFMGHSMGTIVCQHIAAQHPGLVQGLFLCGTLLEPPQAARQGLRDRAKLARSEGMVGIADAIVQAATATDTKRNNAVALAFVRESIMRQCPEGYARSCEALAEATAADPRLISCPVLSVTGEEDVVGPPSVSRQLAEQLEQGRALVLAGCGHWTTIERPVEVNDALKAFLAGNRR